MMHRANIAAHRPNLLRQIGLKTLRSVLPAGKTFWKVYSPVIRILQDSQEHKIIRGKLTSLLDIKKGDSVLDAGCGRGEWAREVAPSASLVIGLDLERGMLRAAKEQGMTGRGRVLVEGSVDSLPFKSGSIDKIGSILVYGYLDQEGQTRAVNELFRVLKPGGRAGIVTPGKGANFFKVLRAEAQRRKDQGTFLKELPKLPLGATAAFFGLIAQLKDRAGQWNFPEEKELYEKFEAAGFVRVRPVERVYADQGLLAVFEKPL